MVNGLALEGTTIELAQANLKSGARILELGPNTITRDQWVFDFSFPEEHGDPNPHVWMNPLYALRYAELVRDALAEMDAPSADYYRQNTELFRTRIDGARPRDHGDARDDPREEPQAADVPRLVRRTSRRATASR